MTNHTNQQPVISARGLTKHFSRGKKTVEAVRGLDLEIHRGELVAFLGPNGAGKSTTLRMLTTLIPPTSGTAEVAGHDVVRAQGAVRRSIGYVGQGNAAAYIQRGRDELMSQARAHGIPRAAAKARIDELLSAFDLQEYADRTVQTLSGGQRRRLDIAIGLLNHPEVLFLDEPSTGLDPQNRANLQDQIQRLHDDGTTIVLTTHYLEEADALAGRVIVIDHGLVIADDTASRLKERLGDLLLLTFGTEGDATAAAARAESGLTGPTVVERTGTQVSIRSPRGADTAPALAIDLAAHGTPAIRMEVRTPTLDDVFLDLTGRSLRESAESASNTQTEGAAA
ncbi:ATP-binding cassette domain-containing protein [Nocardioides panzhihuensis]|uniref:ABC-2 type transport system ATP-binding protein n=1 Tax=Nocardioides panzhihuensis TaxID=860243 RepID=A0A7Z0IU64_9ACTN|nr:ATP-binding cassette domain-containing protein [Nocardioides panzhihuensis]NYI79640.1 ABC-2 type transport system ATP-binding protein [Nocardioides panzhihuensis]